MAIAEVGAVSQPVGNWADDQERELALPTSVLPAQGMDEFDVEVVDVSGGKGLHGGSRGGFIATPVLGSRLALAVAAVATTAVVFLFGSGQCIEASVLADAADQGGARRQISQHRSVGEGGVGADQQRARGAAGELIDGVPQLREAFCPAAADGGSRRVSTPVFPLLGIGAALGFRLRSVVQLEDRWRVSRGTVARRYTASGRRCGGPNRPGRTDPARGPALRSAAARKPRAPDRPGHSNKPSRLAAFGFF